MTSNGAGLSLPTGIALTGGLPTKSQDLAPSIIFVVAFCLLVPLAVLRIARASSRTTTLIRPAVFIVARIGTYIVRALMSNGNYSTGYFTAELILLLCGFVLICEPLLSMLDAHVSRNTEPSIHNKDLLDRAIKLLKLALVVALILGIVAGSSIGNITNGDTSGLSSYKSERNANAIICLVITVLVIPVTLAAQASKSLPTSASMHLLACSGLLVIASAFKLYIYLEPQPATADRTKILFYVLSSTPEWLVTLLYLVFNIQELYQLKEHAARMKEEKRLKKAAKKGQLSDVEMGHPQHEQPQRPVQSMPMSYPQQAADGKDWR